MASFFVSRVDTAADKLLDANGSTEALALKGKVAVANAQLAYELFQGIFGSDQWRVLEAAGARVQRPLWASTGTKSPDYSDVLYVESLIGPSTVNTMPVPTIEAFLDHGTVTRTVDRDYEGAHAVAAGLIDLGISLEDITDRPRDGRDRLLRQIVRRPARWRRIEAPGTRAGRWRQLSPSDWMTTDRPAGRSVAVNSGASK